MKKKIWQKITPKNWCKNEFDNGEGAFCSLGWTNEIYGYSVSKTEQVKYNLRKYIAKKTKKNLEYISVAQWNDSPKRKFSEVKAAFKAIDA